MKKLMFRTIAVFLMTTGAFADGGDHSTSSASLEKLTDTSEAVTTALTVFGADNGQDVIDLYRGIKASPANGGMSVKVYLTDGTNISYGCHRHEASDPFECHEK